MKQISLMSICALFSITLFGANCVMEEEIGTEEYESTQLYGGELSILESQESNKLVSYTGLEQRKSPAGDNATPPANDDQTPQNPGIDFDIGDDLVGSNPRVPIVESRSYKCDTSNNYIRFVEFERFDLAGVVVKSEKDALVACAKACDYLGSDCEAFFYIDSFDNTRSCGLVKALHSDAIAMWVDAQEGSQVCYLK